MKHSKRSASTGIHTHTDWIKRNEIRSQNNKLLCLWCIRVGGERRVC